MDDTSAGMAMPFAPPPRETAFFQIFADTKLGRGDHDAVFDRKAEH